MPVFFSPPLRLLTNMYDFLFRQLKEGYQNEAIPNEVPELVRVLLTQYPDALAVRRPGNLVTIIIVSIIYFY